jgi:hypothetical protein
MELLERQAVLLPFAFLCRETALVDFAIKTWVCARGELIASSVAAHANHKGVDACKSWRVGSERTEAKPPLFSSDTFPQEQRHAVGQAKAAGRHDAQHARRSKAC